MAVSVNEKDLNKLAEEMIGEFKSEQDFDAFTKALRKQWYGLLPALTNRRRGARMVSANHH